jgi:hypothetical protein
MVTSLPKPGYGKALLAVAVVQALLHAPHLAVGHAVGRPGRKADAVARVLGQVGQVLQADALAVLAVAGRAGEVMRTAALKKNRRLPTS